MMKKFALYHLMVVLLLGGLASSCQDDSYYDRPASLEPPIYEQLKAKGYFTNYLACVDKAGYKQNLSTAGYYTVFAPTDEAFEAYLLNKGLSSVADLDTVAAKAIVAYSLAPSSSNKSQIDDWQTNATSTTANTVYQNVAFKRESFAYKWVYPYTDIDGNTKDVVDANASEGAYTHGFRTDNFNKKNIPYFTTGFLTTKKLTAYDYNYFYPDKVLSDFNVADATVTEWDIYAENGVVHVVDKLIEPLKNLEELLASSAECSDFRDVLERYFVKTNVKAPEEFQRKYEQARGERKDIFIKWYPELVFSPNCEAHIGSNTNKQIDGWTLFAPTNAALQTFYTERFFSEGYKSLDEMPSFVIAEMVNAHMFPTTVWPSKFAGTQNEFGEPARFNPESDVEGRHIGSNGLFYVVNKVQATNAFSTVLGDILLNPNYTLMYQALVSTQNQFILKNPDANVTIFLITNEQFAKLGLSYNYGTNAWEVNNPAWPGVSAANALDRLMNIHILLESDLKFVAGNWGLAKTYGGEYIRYNITGLSAQVWSSGNPYVLTSLPRIYEKNPETTNGYSIVTERASTAAIENTLSFSTENIGTILSTNTTYRAFYNYLEKSANSKVEGGEGELSRLVYNPDTKAITGVLNTDEQTFLIPNATAIAKAVTEGYLPAITVNDFTQAEQEKLLKFVQYHILKKAIIFPNGKMPNGLNVGPAITHYKTPDGDTYVNIDLRTANTLIATDALGMEAKAVATNNSASVNVLANRAVVHLIDNFLRY
jgi:uncharacterized surface protein with fasciclin (FAS1) repeats